MITLIAACSMNKVIGKDNELPWKIPADLKRFKTLTSGHPVLMGRKTYESIGRPLPNRTNIVISRDPNFKPEGCLVYGNIEEAVSLFRNDLFVIGGGEIYTQTIGMADRIELTLVDLIVEGDAWFPEVPGHFEVVEDSGELLTDEKISYSFITFAKTAKPVFVQ